MYKGYARGVCECGETACRVSGSVKAATRSDAKQKFRDLASNRPCRDCRGRTEKVKELYVRQTNEGGDS